MLKLTTESEKLKGPIPQGPLQTRQKYRNRKFNSGFSVIARKDSMLAEQSGVLIHRSVTNLVISFWAVVDLHSTQDYQVTQDSHGQWAITMPGFISFSPS